MSDFMVRRLRQMEMNPCNEAADLIEQQQAERDELAATVERLNNYFIAAAARPDIERLFELQPIDDSDGSYEVDGQSLTELGIAFNDTPATNLNVVKRDIFSSGYYDGMLDADPEISAQWAKDNADRNATQRYPDKE